MLVIQISHTNRDSMDFTCVGAPVLGHGTDACQTVEEKSKRAVQWCKVKAVVCMGLFFAFFSYQTLPQSSNHSSYFIFTVSGCQDWRLMYFLILLFSTFSLIRLFFNLQVFFFSQFSFFHLWLSGLKAVVFIDFISLHIFISTYSSLFSSPFFPLLLFHRTIP